MNEILHMSGYGLYVWSSIGIVIVSLAAMSWHARSSFKRVQEKSNWGRDAQR
jgi:heme exporter protein D